MLLHGEALPVDSSHHAPLCILEEDDGHLAPQGLSLVHAVLLASKGLVLSNVQDHRGLAGKPVHETFLEHRFHVVSPGHCKRASNGHRSSRTTSIISHQVPISCCQIESFPVQELRPPTQSYLFTFLQTLGGLQVQSVLVSLSFQVGQQVLVGGEGLVVLQVMCESQGCIEALNLHRPPLSACPLPSSMDALCIQHMIRTQEECRGQELEQALILALVPHWSLQGP